MKIFLSFLLTFFCGSNVICQNLVQNGSMTGPVGENVTAPSWIAPPLASGYTPDINDVGILHTSSGYNWYLGFPIASSDGGTWQNVFDNEYIQQTVTGLSIGQVYYFSYEYCTQGIASPFFEFVTPMAPNITITGASGYVNPITAGNLFSWNRYTTTIIATSASVTISAAGNVLAYLAYDGFYLSTEPLTPVKLVDFKCAAQNRTVKLSWITASEINSSHFVIQRSIDGNNWKEIGTVPAAGNSVQTINYTYLDNFPSSANFYRLKQVDIDNQFELSKVCFTEITEKEQDIFRMYPNPAHDYVHVLINSDLLNTGQLQIFNMTGEKVKQVMVSPGNRLLDIKLNDLKKAVYLVRLINSLDLKMYNKYLIVQ